MRKLKNYFKLIITAVICFFVSVVSDKKMSRKVKELITGGQAVFSQNNYSRYRGMESSENYSWNEDRLKRIMVISEKKGTCPLYGYYNQCSFADRYSKFFWMQGPGDPGHIPKGVCGSNI